MDHRVFGILDRYASLRTAPAEFVVASRLETLIEVPHTVEHASANKQVRGRGEAFLDISVLAKKPARIDELRD
jgi:hypothetical protein